MELRKRKDSYSIIDNLQGDDSTVYLFGSELYCGWCLQSFTCPVRVKIHCHVEHLLKCMCGEKFGDKSSLSKHIVNAGCQLPPPFHWSNFLTLPSVDQSRVPVPAADVTEECGGDKGQPQPQLIVESDQSDENASHAAANDADKTGNKKDLVKNKMFFRTRSTCSQMFKHRQFSCMFCLYRSYDRANLRRHIQKMHENVEKFTYSPVVKQDVPNEEHSDEARFSEVIGVNIGVDIMAQNVINISESRKDNTEKMVVEKTGMISPSDNSDANQDRASVSHRADDVEFVSSCFPSVSAAGQLSCILCSSECANLNEAKVHVYEAHSAALQQWRSTHTDVSDSTAAVQHVSSKESFANGQTGELKNMQIAECDIAKLYENVCTDEVRASVSADDNRDAGRTVADICSSQASINSTKASQPDGESDALASSLCWLGSSDQAVATNRTLVNESLSPRVHEKIVSVSETESSDVCSNEHTKKTNAMQISRRCTFCHRLCSNRFNCQRHEAACLSRVGCASYGEATCNKKSTTLVRYVNELDMYYCSRCGFSDHDGSAVKAHVMNPRAHLIKNSRLFVKLLPSHDYFGGRRLVAQTGNYTCELCRRQFNSRQKLILHFSDHSSPASLTDITVPANSSFVQEKIGEKRNSTAKTCHKCGRSFTSVVMYLYHRNTCRRSVPAFCKQVEDGKFQCTFCQFTSMYRKSLHRHLRAKHSEVLKPKAESEKPCVKDVCKKIAGGRWQCKFCVHSSLYRGGLYKHIRVKHAELVQPKVAAEKPYVKDMCEETADGRWQCKFCDCSIRQRGDLYKHIRNKHADLVNSKLEAGKPYIKDVCVEKGDGRWQCKLCDHCHTRRGDLYKHIRVKHADEVSASLNPPKLTDVSVFCEGNIGEWRCKLCKYSTTYKTSLHKHIRSAHSKLFQGNSPKACILRSPHANSSQTSDSEGEKICNKSSPVSNVTKIRSPFSKSCLRCRRKFSSNSLYLSHLLVCSRQYLDSCMEIVADGRVKCCLCSQTYSRRDHCVVHLRQKHLQSDELEAGVSGDPLPVPTIKTEVPDNNFIKTETE